MRIFVADDSAVVRDRLVVMLSDLPNVDVIGVADNVSKALESVRRLTPDVAIVDIRMPGGSGFDVLDDIKKRLPETVVIMLTNYANEQYRKRSMEGGADFFMDKSSEFDRIPRVLAEMGSTE